MMFLQRKAKAVPAKAVAAKASGGAKGTAVRATAVAAAPAPAPAVAAAPAPKPSSSDDAMALLDSMGAVSLVCLACHELLSQRVRGACRAGRRKARWRCAPSAPPPSSCPPRCAPSPKHAALVSPLLRMLDVLACVSA